jgi:hypothetical protein
MTTNNKFYTKVSVDLKELIRNQKTSCDKVDTTTLTKEIKTYFKLQNKEKLVRSTDTPYGEFLFDISVFKTNKLPFKNKTYNNLETNDYFLELIVESELGGTGGSNAEQLFRNVAEDFHKLLICKSQYKILIAAYSINARNLTKCNYVTKLFNIYKHLNNKDDILIILIAGETEGTKQIKLFNDKVSNYIFSINHYEEI